MALFEKQPKIGLFGLELSVGFSVGSYIYSPGGFVTV